MENTSTKAETVNNVVTQLETFLHEYYLELGLIICFIAGTLTEYHFYVTVTSPIWGLLWGLPMAALVLFYHRK